MSVKQKQRGTSQERIQKMREIRKEVVQATAPEGGVYLSGPIRKVDDNGILWRKQFKQDYGERFKIFSPIDEYNPEEVEVLNDPIKYNEDSDKKQILPSEYTMKDKTIIDKSDVVFVGLPDCIGRGTMLECGYAFWENDMPFFVWTIDGQEESGWIYEHCEFMHSDREQVVDEMDEYMNG